MPGLSAVAYAMMAYGQNEAFAGSASMVLRESAALQNTNARASAYSLCAEPTSFPVRSSMRLTNDSRSITSPLPWIASLRSSMTSSSFAAFE